MFDLADLSQRRELTRQVKLVSRLDHPHVAKLQGLFFHKASNKDEAYLESAYYPNGTLGRYLARADVAAPRLPAPHAAVLDRASDKGAAGALACLQQLLAGLAAVHALPAVHGDVKLANALVAADGLVVLTDFDFASGGGAQGSVGGASSLLGAGTFLYMPPEVRRGQAATAASDMFGWGLCALLAFVPEAAAAAAKALGPHPDAARLEAEVGRAAAALLAADPALGALVQ